MKPLGDFFPVFFFQFIDLDGHKDLIFLVNFLS